MKSDVDLQADVLEELTWEPSVNAASIGVTANDGVITLTGMVDSYAEKRAAEQAVKRVTGVRGVAQELEVRLPALAERTDTDIARAAASALEWDIAVPHQDVRVTVHQGWVTLEGKVEWQYQRSAAERAVRNLTGVRGVTDLITLKPRMNASAIKEKIEAAFKRNAELAAQKVSVEARDGKAILNGRLRSWAERNEAERAAWAAPGVTSVESHLTVGF